MIQVRARHATSDDAMLDVHLVSNQTGPITTWQEIRPESAVTIASWWQSPGTIGNVLAGFASGAVVDRDALLDDISRTRHISGYYDGTMTEDDCRALDCLSTFAIHYGE